MESRLKTSRSNFISSFWGEEWEALRSDLVFCPFWASLETSEIFKASNSLILQMRKQRQRWGKWLPQVRAMVSGQCSSSWRIILDGKWVFITPHSAEHSHPAFDVLGSQKWERTDPDLEGLTVLAHGVSLYRVPLGQQHSTKKKIRRVNANFPWLLLTLCFGGKIGCWRKRWVLQRGVWTLWRVLWLREAFGPFFRCGNGSQRASWLAS